MIAKKSHLPIDNKLLNYKAVIKPIWSYGIELRGCASKSNIVIMQRSQSKILRAITNAPRYVTYHILHTKFSGFGGLEVACWHLVPKLVGSNPAEAVGFLRVNKNPQHVGGHGCLSVVIVVCCQVDVSATG